MSRRYRTRRGHFVGDLAQDLGKHALHAGAGAFKKTVTPDFIAKLATKGVNKLTDIIGRKIRGKGGPRYRTKRGRGGARWTGRRSQRRGGLAVPWTDWDRGIRRRRDGTPYYIT